MKKFLQKISISNAHLQNSHSQILTVPEIVGFDQSYLKNDLEFAFQCIFHKLRKCGDMGLFSMRLQILSKFCLCFPLSKSILLWWENINDMLNNIPFNSSEYVVLNLQRIKFITSIINQIIIPSWDEFSDVKMIVEKVGDDLYFVFDWSNNDNVGINKSEALCEWRTKRVKIM